MATYTYKTLGSGYIKTYGKVLLFTVPEAQQYILKAVFLHTVLNNNPVIALVQTYGSDLKDTISKFNYNSVSAGRFETSGSVAVAVGPGQTNQNVTEGKIVITSTDTGPIFGIGSITGDGTGTTGVALQGVGITSSIAADTDLTGIYAGSAVGGAITVAQNTMSVQLSGQPFGAGDKLYLSSSTADSYLMAIVVGLAIS